MSALTAALPPSTSEMGSKGAAVTPDTAYKTTQGYTVFCLAIVSLNILLSHVAIYVTRCDTVLQNAVTLYLY